MSEIFWICFAVGILSLLVLGVIVLFLSPRLKKGKFMEELSRRINNANLDSTSIKEISSQFFTRRNEFWTIIGQFAIAIFLVATLTILLLTKTVSAEAGLPIFSGIAGFSIAKGVSTIHNLSNPEKDEKKIS